jgi:multicomponent Na+:H+ antiporter subunit D
MILAAATVASLPPWPVAGPLAVAGLLLAGGKLLPRHGPDILALLTALAAAAVCVALATGAADGPIIYWFGGWTPRADQAIGISFRVDLAGASVAAFVAGLFAITLLFAWGYFDEVHAHFHVLMLLFMAAMIGFCLTADVFNMFVWFEVMSVAAFALTGYELRASQLEGAINFTVLNTIGSYLFLGGIGLAYALAGSLDMASIGRAAAGGNNDAVVAAAFVLMATGLLVKAAQVPFHFWLPDAHAVAPSPVSVIFSGAMVALGVFGLARLVFTVFAGAPQVMMVVHTLPLGMGAASVVVGGAMTLLQRHVKRMLAFSTVSHIGVLLIGLALGDRAGLAGALLYLAGQGLVKASLFMVAGILLAICGGIDEIGLRGLGRPIWPAGVAMAVGGLLLAGLPIGLMDDGITTLASSAGAAGRIWLLPVLVFGGATTGGAVLRAAGRIFAGLGPVAAEEERSPTEDEQEKADRPLPLMLACAAVPLVLVLAGSHRLDELARHAAAQFGAPGNESVAVAMLPAWIAVALAVAIASFDLLHRQLPGPVSAVSAKVTGPVAAGLDYLHSGAVGDYVAWLAVGIALFTTAFWLV